MSKSLLHLSIEPYLIEWAKNKNLNISELLNSYLIQLYNNDIQNKGFDIEIAKQELKELENKENILKDIIEKNKQMKARLNTVETEEGY
jgi:hypothetical protein